MHLKDHTEDQIRARRLFIAKGVALGFRPGDGTPEGKVMSREEALLRPFLEQHGRLKAGGLA